MAKVNRPLAWLIAIILALLVLGFAAMLITGTLVIVPAFSLLIHQILGWLIVILLVAAIIVGIMNN